MIRARCRKTPGFWKAQDLSPRVGTQATARPHPLHRDGARGDCGGRGRETLPRCSELFRILFRDR